MERYYEIGKINWKYNLIYHTILLILLCITVPFFMSVTNLTPNRTARVLEFCVSLFGIILLVPVFALDQDKTIREVLSSKKESIVIIHLIRTAESAIVLIAVILGFLTFLKYGACQFPFWQYFYGTFTNALFLGGMGMLFFSIFDQIVVGYMIPILYYMLCFGSGKQYLGKFYLFSMSLGSYDGKQLLLCTAVLMILLALGFRFVKRG